MNHPNNDATQLTVTLDEAIAQAVLQHQQEQAQQAVAAQAERQQTEQKAIARFQLPFDEATLTALPNLKFRFEKEDLNPIAWFQYQDLTIEVCSIGNHSNCETWAYVARRQSIEVLKTYEHVYPNHSWASYETPEALGRDFLVWLHEAANTPTPKPKPPESTITEYVSQKRRERFVKAALQGALMGITNTGVEAGACLPTALFAIETAYQVLTLVDATPLQRKVLNVLTLEAFTDWLRSHPGSGIVGSLTDDEHPVCCYLMQCHGIVLNFSNLALYDESGSCVLGNDNDSKALVPHALPLSLVGDWLPSFMDWRAFDPDTDEETEDTFTAEEVLAFLEPFHS